MVEALGLEQEVDRSVVELRGGSSLLFIPLTSSTDSSMSFISVCLCESGPQAMFHYHDRCIPAYHELCDLCLALALGNDA